MTEGRMAAHPFLRQPLNLVWCQLHRRIQSQTASGEIRGLRREGARCAAYHVHKRLRDLLLSFPPTTLERSGRYQR